MLTVKDLRERYGDIDVGRLPDDVWNELNFAMIANDWTKIRELLLER